ncbi:hypothetical protein [Comamonas serinivorans]|nr:hypothetical protein [Comamonas serinivorans]
MRDGLRQAWANHRHLVALAVLLFVGNQALEWAILQGLGASHAQLCRHDCGWYTSVMDHGYQRTPSGHARRDAANWAFFPAFPWVAKGVGLALNLPAATAAVVTSKAFLLLAVFAFMKLGALYLPRLPALALGAVVAFSPYALYGNVGYTESMFLFVSCVFFILLKQERHLAAGLVGGVLSAVRVVGLFAFVSYLVTMVRDVRQRRPVAWDARLFGALLIPLGLACFMLHLHSVMGDALAFSHVQVAWGRSVGNPLRVLFLGALGGGFSQYLVVTVLLALGAVGFCWRRNMPELAAFTLFGIGLPLFAGLLSMPRFVFWQAPVLLLLAHLVSTGRVWLVALPLCTLGQVVMYMGWFSGKTWTF